MKHGDINNPTTRKVLNRGFAPVTWHGPDGIASGWIVWEKRKFLLFNSPSTGRKRLPITERRNMRSL